MEAAYDFYTRGIELLNKGDSIQAALLLEKAKEIEPGKASITESLGRAYYNYGQYSDALRNFMESIEIQPADDFLHYCTAISFVKLGNRKMAAKHIKIAIAMQPEKKKYGNVLARINSKI